MLSYTYLLSKMSCRRTHIGRTEMHLVTRRPCKVSELHISSFKFAVKFTVRSVDPFMLATFRCNNDLTCTLTYYVVQHITSVLNNSTLHCTHIDSDPSTRMVYAPQRDAARTAVC